MTNAQAARTPRQTMSVWLLASGVVLAIVGLMGASAALRSADVASLLASQPTRFLLPAASGSMTSQIALNFDPSSAHYVAPDYTAVWLGVVVVAVGLLAVVAAIVIALRARRAA